MGELVFDSAVSGEKLSGEIVVADAGIGSGKGILERTKGADPDGGAVIDAGVGVENGAAAGAEERVVGEQGEIVDLQEWGVHDAEGDHEGR